METIIKQKAINYLYSIVGQPLIYALKSPDTELYDFGFGEFSKIATYQGKQPKTSMYTLHIMCRFKVIRKIGKQQIKKYYEDTSCDTFHSEIRDLIGMNVLRIALSDKNDLWIDFGDYWVVFVTFENNEESWRFFTANSNDPHLVVSNSLLDFVE